MSLIITQVMAGIYQTKVRANEFTICKTGAGWDVTVVNPSVRAYSNGIAFPVHFASLEEVETRYKSLKGLSSLMLSETSQTIN